MAGKMNFKKGTKKVSSTPKYEFGAQKMFVPPKADLGDAITPLSTGIGYGSQFGPIGTAAGAGIGAALGLANVIEKNKQSNFASKRNNAIDAYNSNFSRNMDPQYQQQVFEEGTSGLSKPKTSKQQGEENRKKREERFKKTPNVDKEINEEAIRLGKNEHGLPKGGQKSKVDINKTAPKYRTNQYAKGAKIIEVEEDELIFQKTPDGKFALKEDHKNSPTHEDGGQKTIGVEGDIIFPADMREEAMKAYSEGDHAKLESLRLSLPKDTPNKGTAIRSNVAVSKKKVAPTFETGVQKLRAENRAEVSNLPEPLKSTILKGSVAKFANGTSFLYANHKTDQMNPAALTYTDRTDLTDIKADKNVFNYPPTPAVGYVPSQQVPDAIGYGSYLVAQERKNDGNIVPEMNSVYENGTMSLRIRKYQDGVREFDPTLGGLFPNVLNESPYATYPEYSYAPTETPVANAGLFNPVVTDSILKNAQGGAMTKPSSINNRFNLDLGGANNALQTTAELAPTLYNTFRGMSRPVESTRRFFTPEQYQRVDRYAPERRAVQESYRIEADNLKKNTGGSLGLYLANQAQASNRRFNRLQDINSNLISDYRTTDNANVDLRNNARQMNLGLENQYDLQDLQNQAQGQNMLAAASTGISDYTQQRRLDRNLTSRDNSLLDIIGTQNYGVQQNPNTGRWSIKYRRG